MDDDAGENVSGTAKGAVQLDEESTEIAMQAPNADGLPSTFEVDERINKHFKESEVSGVQNTCPTWMYGYFVELGLAKDSLSRQEGLSSRDGPSVSLDDSCQDNVCSECGKRVAEFDCANCGQSMCFTCTDAIHIIRELSMHAITRCPPRVIQPLLADATTKRRSEVNRSSPPPQALSPAPKVPFTRQFNAATQFEQRLDLPLGTKLFFRAEDCGRWSRELLHGTVVGQDCSVRSGCGSREDSSSLTYFYRILWLRGVEALANGFFRANMLLPPPCWPVEIGLFPTRLSAYRAVLTAERLARAKLRRELVSGRWHDKRPSDFPSLETVNAILDETDVILGHEYRTRLTQRDDAGFLEAVSRGTWRHDDWMKAIGLESEVREEAAAAQELDDELRAPGAAAAASLSVAAELMIWSPRGRMRFFLVEQHELLLPEPVQRSHVASILRQMLYVSMGFAWSRWQTFMVRHRRHDRRQRRRAAGVRIQRWWRHAAAKAEQLRVRGALASPMDALTLYHRRQVEAAKLHQFLVRQWHARQRLALQRWADHTRALRGDDGAEAICPKPLGSWHPSHGISSLPRLPRTYAHKRPDGSVAIDDLKLYKQFRANHAGPTESSYWVIRPHVLMGVYPAGLPAFRDARRIVSRADYATSILLQEIGTFVCVAEPSELQAHEANVDASGLVHLQKKQHTSQAAASPRSCQTPWLFERIARAKHALLHGELTGAIRVCERHAELAQRACDDFVAALPAPADVAALSGDARSQYDALASRLALARHNVRKAQETLAGLKPLDFVVFPIAKDGVPPDDEAFAAFLVGLEDRLRRRERLYVFSMHGHGRTGLVAALLLGRLYGLAATDALDRAQRLHDCQYAMHGVGATKFVSSPHASAQIAMVSQLLARWNDAIYAPVVSENSSAQFVQWRAQQRGTPIDKFASREGFMVSDRVDEAALAAQRREFEALQRVAKRESAAASLRLARRREQRDRDLMRQEDAENAAGESRSCH